MLLLRLLGGATLEDESGALTGRATQRRRLVLLAILAVHHPRPVARDRLVAWLWPEHDAERARHLLRDSLYLLRGALGDGTLAAVGDDLRLAPQRLRCDLWEFDDALRQERLEDAVQAYGGPLLDGLHLPDCGELEHWLDAERARLAQRHAAALEALAEASEARGDLAAAERWWRQLAKRDPYNGRVALRLMRALGAAGDRAGALRHARSHATLLRTEFEAEPDAEVTAFAERLRVEPHVPSAAAPDAARSVAPSAFGATAPALSAAPPPAPPVAAAPHGARAGRGAVAAAIAAVLALAAAIGAGGAIAGSVGSPPPSTRLSPVAIAVLPFAYRGSPRFGYLGEGMVDLLAPKLDGAAGYRSVDPRVILRVADRDTGAWDPRRARRMAERVGAGLFVLGSVVEAGGRLQVSATVYDEQATARGSMETTAGSEAEIFDAADRMARRILTMVQDAPLELARTADQTTASLTALKAYLEGERDLRADRPMRAMEAFERAVRIDTAFAIAHYRLGSLTPDGPLARERLARALRQGDRLGERHRRLALAMDDVLRGHHAAAEQRYRQILAAHPDDAEAWANLGWLHLTKGYLLGGAWVDAREPFERLQRLDPRNAGGVWGLAVVAARERRQPALDSLTDIYVRLDPTSYFAANVRAMRAVVVRDTAGLERFVSDVRRRPDSFAVLGAGVVTWATGDLAVGRRLWRLIAEPSRAPDGRALARVTLAKIELTNGRWRAAGAELDDAAAVDAAAALEHRAVLALTRFLRPTASELRALRDSLQRRVPAAVARDGGDGAVARDVRESVRLYLLGAISVRLGDEEGAMRHALALERVDRGSRTDSFAADRARMLRADLAWHRGRPQEALSWLQGAQLWSAESAAGEEAGSPFFLATHLHERFARAELLHALGRDDEALPWYRALTYDLVYNGPAHLRMAEIQERRGARAQAAEHYRRFVELWAECDPELRPLVDGARRRLARLAHAPR